MEITAKNLKKFSADFNSFAEVVRHQLLSKAITNSLILKKIDLIPLRLEMIDNAFKDPMICKEYHTMLFNLLELEFLSLQKEINFHGITGLTINEKPWEESEKNKPKKIYLCGIIDLLRKFIDLYRKYFF